MVPPVWLEEREGAKAFHELGTGLRPRKASQQLLQDEPGREDLIHPEKRVPERCNLWRILLGIAAQR